MLVQRNLTLKYCYEGIRQRLSAGMYVMANRAISDISSNGTIFRQITSNFTFPMSAATYRFGPTGGVTWPMDRFSTRITPSWIMLISRDLAMGMMMGTRI